MSKRKAFEVERLTVNYDKTPVLWDVSFDIDEGQVVGIIGPNGAGKSSLIKAALGLIEPLSGKVLFWDCPYKKQRRKIAYVPQRSSVDWEFPITALEVVLMGRYGRLGFFKRPKAADVKAALECLEQLEMSAFADRQINELSGGQQQRLFIARALLQEADLYFMDEPFVGIDIATEKLIISLLRSLKEKKKTVFVVHHDLNTVPNYFDSLVLLNKCLVACGPVKEVFTKDNIERAFGKKLALLEEVAKLSQEKTTGLL